MVRPAFGAGVGVAVGVAVEDGDAGTLEPVGDGFTPDCGEQAARIRTVTRRYRARTTGTTNAGPNGYSNALGFLRADGALGHAGASLGPGAIVAQRRRPGHHFQPVHGADGAHRHSVAVHARSHNRAD